MPKRALARLLLGFKQFREKFYLGSDETYSRLAASQQSPKTLIIGCSDSRVDPAILSSAGPGELFVVRNVANLVPPYESDQGRHGVSAAIEFAVVNLKVEIVIILGHRQCGGIQSLVFPSPTKQDGFVHQWMKIAEPAKERALKLSAGRDEAALWRCCELESIKTSLDNIRTFPFVTEAIQSRGLNILGIYFDLEKGELLELNEATGEFSPLDL